MDSTTKKGWRLDFMNDIVFRNDMDQLVKVPVNIPVLLYQVGGQATVSKAEAEEHGEVVGGGYLCRIMAAKALPVA